VPEQRYSFAEFTLEPRQRRLAADGNEVAVSARAFDALIYLVEHSGETVSKQRLLAAVWPKTVVEENSLTKAVSTLRHALGDTPNGRPYILTIPGRGYRFVAPVEVLAPREGSTGHLRKPSIAFLPLDNLTGAARHAVDADNLTEDLTTAFANNPAYRVLARNSSCKYKGTPIDARHVGRDLDVDYVVEGSLQKSGDGLRLTVQLIDTTNGAHVWTYQITSIDLSLDAFRREIGIGGAGLTIYLQCELLRHYVRRLGSKDPAVLIGRLQPETLAMVAFCGIYGRDDVSESEMTNALRLLDRAAHLRPRDVHVLTHYGIALVGLPSTPVFVTDPCEAEGRYEHAVELFDRALAVGQGAATVNNLVGIGLWLAGHWRRAQPLIDRALRDFPYPMLRVYRAEWRLYVEGKVDETIAELSEALETERNQTQIEQFGFPQLIGVAHLARGEWQAAIARLENAHAIAPGEHGPLAALIAAHVLAGDFGEAERLVAAFKARNADGLLHKTFFRRACLHPDRSGIDPASPVGRMICVTMPEALRRVGLAWALPAEDCGRSTAKTE